MAGWSFRKPITIDSTKVDADLTDFPVVIHLNSDSDLAEHAQASGDDIKFEDGNGNQLSHEIESYDNSTGTLWAHVKLPSLSSTSDTTIFIYYGNSDASNQESVGDVWSNQHEAVYHLDESVGGTGTNNVYSDSTGNGNDGNDFVSASGQGGKIFKGQSFDGADDYVRSSDWGVMAQSSYTVSFWARIADGDGKTSPWTWGESRNGARPLIILYVGDTFSSNNPNVRFNDSRSGKNPVMESSADIADGDWHHIALVQSSTNSRELFVDWVSTVYNNQLDPLSFYAVGAEEALSPSKQAIVTASSTTAASSPQTDTRNVPTSAIGKTSVSEAAQRSTGASANATTTGLATGVGRATLGSVEWPFRKEITIDSTKVSGDLTDFPVLVHLNNDSDLAEHAQASGDDIKFEDGNGNQLSHEIESYNSSTGTLWAHVRVPSLSSTSDTTIFIYYGNADASNQESIEEVWSNGYQAVYHLDESASGTGNTDVYKDSTANDHHGDDNVSARQDRSPMDRSLTVLMTLS